MDLTKQNYPEGYQILYDPVKHVFRLKIKSDLGKCVLERLAQSGTFLAHHQSSYDLELDTFSYQSKYWGYGSCIRIIQDTKQMLWDTWECAIHQSTEKTIHNALCSLSVLFDALHACMSDRGEITRVRDPIQFSTITTIIQPQIACAYWITSSMSALAKKKLERLAKHGSDVELMTFFRHIVESMSDIYQRCLDIHSDSLYQTPQMINCHGASQGLLSVHFCEREWRIIFECVGASLCIDPIYIDGEEDQGANFQPHNTDRAIHQLTILAGLVTCYEQLQLIETM